ncbi:MAG TPA: DNA replication/repair protein RecF [Caulobacteraceae bacterium]|jgi:DNA replication and repair protein RecF|nr:DNA replication/repair protein RecF [Caulobacteraceae bacterium]
MRSALTRVSLTDFRSYDHAELAIEGTAYLFGQNGAGKTNFLEAISYLAPGRGLRNATVGEVGRRESGEAQGRAWAVSALVAGDAAGDEARLGTGIEFAKAARRTVRIDGETVAPGRLLEHLRLVWLTPAQDRLFLEARSDRLRFFDRLAFAAEPAHATAVSTYEKALRERLRLLTDGPMDEAWLNALEARLGDAGAQAAGARARTLQALQDEIETRADRPFPQADLSLTGPAETAAARGEAAQAIAAEIAAGMRASRGRDADAGRSLFGPHRTELEVRHRERGRPAAEGSTGEQKALILNLVLAQAARLSRAISQPNPILLLDEVAAHLDPFRRAALFDEITALGLQVFLTGTEEALFEGLKGRAQGVRVDRGALTTVD